MLVGEWRLEATLGELQEIFGRAAHDPEMYADWPVRPEHVDDVQRFVADHEIDISRYDYFVEADGRE